MKKFRFGTKAETLEQLSGRLTVGEVLPLAYFTANEWREDPHRVLGRLRDHLQSDRVVVRSSAIGEDGAERSAAGAFTSVLHTRLDSDTEMREAVDSVVASFQGHPMDQVLVQPMLADVTMSGVLMTRSLSDGAPYYSINYDDETGETDSVTGGNRVSKTVYVNRGADPSHIRSERIASLLRAAKEIEAICGDLPLDVEFGLTRDGRVIIFQVRRISVWKHWHAEVVDEVHERLPFIEEFVEERMRRRPGLLGSRTVLGNMPDWNPAEMIGTTPGRLATSLYRALITRDVWRCSRQALGYRPVLGEELMVVIGGRPFIDVRNSFNSFVPASLDEPIAEQLVEVWLDRLAANPELHDKVEFEVAQTCLGFDFETSLETRYEGAFDAEERSQIRGAYRQLTAEAMRVDELGNLARSEESVRQLESKQQRWTTDVAGGDGAKGTLLQTASYLLQECRAHGTLPFANLARHAFIAEAMLRTAVPRGALAPERVAAFKHSVRTVTTSLSRDMWAVQAGRLASEHFFQRYGHLRPGTYDIKSLSYADRDDLLTGFVATEPTGDGTAPFELMDKEESGLGRLLGEARLPDEPRQLLEYARRAIAGREWAKFVFSKSLSRALELIAAWGEENGVSREHLSHIALEDLLAPLTRPPLVDLRGFLLDLAGEGARQWRIARALKLGFLIRGADDIYVVPVHRTSPNFIGTGLVRGRTVSLDREGCDSRDLFGRIVCIEGADPGFDFIFGKGVAGLVTKYGGANSHMAIRCNELGIPAAIGCGEQTFQRIVSAGAIELNCDTHVLRPLHEG